MCIRDRVGAAVVVVNSHHGSQESVSGIPVTLGDLRPCKGSLPPPVPEVSEVGGVDVADAEPVEHHLQVDDHHEHPLEEEGRVVLGVLAEGGHHLKHAQVPGGGDGEEVERDGHSEQTVRMVKLGQEVQ